MPLHLLSKKSWNVYSPANRARVARDEALAAAAQRDRETHQKDGQSSSIIETLREQEQKSFPTSLEYLGETHGRGKKRKRLSGEDDTERDIREAKDTTNRLNERVKEKSVTLRRDGDKETPIIDGRGNINLFPNPDTKYTGPQGQTHLQKEIERQKSAEVNSAMHLSDATGRTKRDLWYLQGNQPNSTQPIDDQPNNADSRAMERVSKRIAAADPLAVMQRAQSQLKETRRERYEQERDLREMRQREKYRERSLERFSLDDTARQNREPSSNRKQPRRNHSPQYDVRGHERRRRERHRHRHRQRSPEGSNKH